MPVLTAGVAGGVPYYTMPYVEGESLRARIARHSPGDRIPTAVAINVLRDVGRALVHARGVIHRDIKPENILLSEDAAVVADFGIAKALDAARATAQRSPSGVTITAHGAMLGTPAFRAARQRCERASALVGARSTANAVI